MELIEYDKLSILRRIVGKLLQWRALVKNPSFELLIRGPSGSSPGRLTSLDQRQDLQNDLHPQSACRASALSGE